MSVVGVDQSRHLSRLRTKSDNRESSIRVTVSGKCIQLRTQKCPVNKAFVHKASPANLRSVRNEHCHSPIHVHCAVSKSAAAPQPASASLQDQVDRLTSLLQTLEGATTWHDKVSRHTMICTELILTTVPTRCFNNRYWFCKTSQTSEHSSATTGDSLSECKLLLPYLTQPGLQLLHV